MLTLRPSSLRRLPPVLRLRVQVAFARAWEALIVTYADQAVQFVRRLANRLPLEDALARYFREVPVPLAMRETVHARAFLQLADAVPAIAIRPGPEDPWARFRPDRLVEAARRRAQFVEETTLHARMAASQAAAAVVATHARMAVEVADVLRETWPADEAVAAYIRHFELPMQLGDAVFRAALAELAERRLPADQPPVLHVEEPAPVERHAEPPAVAAAGYSLRVVS